MQSILEFIQYKYSPITYTLYPILNPPSIFSFSFGCLLTQNWVFLSVLSCLFPKLNVLFFCDHFKNTSSFVHKGLLLLLEKEHMHFKRAFVPHKENFVLNDMLICVLLQRGQGENFPIPCFFFKVKLNIFFRDWSRLKTLQLFEISPLWFHPLSQSKKHCKDCTHSRRTIVQLN